MDTPINAQIAEAFVILGRKARLLEWIRLGAPISMQNRHGIVSKFTVVHKPAKEYDLPEDDYEVRFNLSVPGRTSSYYATDLPRDLFVVFD